MADRVMNGSRHQSKPSKSGGGARLTGHHDHHDCEHHHHAHDEAENSTSALKKGAPRKAGETPAPKVDAGKRPVERGQPSRPETKLRPAGLTKNEKLLWDVMAAREGPLKAYEILDILKEKGVRAPMTVYRALDGLEAKGVIHKLDAMKAFVRCNHSKPHEMQAFLLCEICQHVKEIEIDAAATGISPIVRRAGFDMHLARLEVRGVCDNCFCERHNHNAGRTPDANH